jgi:hypothetical protein
MKSFEVWWKQANDGANTAEKDKKIPYGEELSGISLQRWS